MSCVQAGGHEPDDGLQDGGTRGLRGAAGDGGARAGFGPGSAAAGSHLPVRLADQRLRLLHGHARARTVGGGRDVALAWAEAVTELGQAHVPDRLYEEARSELGERDLVEPGQPSSSDRRHCAPAAESFLIVTTTV